MDEKSLVARLAPLEDIPKGILVLSSPESDVGIPVGVRAGRPIRSHWQRSKNGIAREDLPRQAIGVEEMIQIRQENWTSMAHSYKITYTLALLFFQTFRP